MVPLSAMAVEFKVDGDFSKWCFCALHDSLWVVLTSSDATCALLVKSFQKSILGDWV